MSLQNVNRFKNLIKLFSFKNSITSKTSQVIHSTYALDLIEIRSWWSLNWPLARTMCSMLILQCSEEFLDIGAPGSWMSMVIGSSVELFPVKWSEFGFVSLDKSVTDFCFAELRKNYACWETQLMAKLHRDEAQRQPEDHSLKELSHKEAAPEIPRNWPVSAIPTWVCTWILLQVTMAR